VDQGGGEPALEVPEVPGADRVQFQALFEGSEEAVDETERMAFSDLAVTGADLLGLDEGAKDVSRELGSFVGDEVSRRAVGSDRTLEKGDDGCGRWCSGSSVP
jgi:hypothetical protein